MNQTIFEIMGSYVELLEMAADEEMKDRFNEALQTSKECLDETLEEKAYNYAKVCKNLDFKKSSLVGQKEHLKSMLDEIDKKIKSIENNKKAMLNNLSEAMQLAEIDKFKNEQFTIYHTKNYNVEILDKEKALEKGLATVEIKPDKVAIKKLIQSGEAVDYATLNEKKTLIIK